jgi:hypothetical protein
MEKIFMLFVLMGFCCGCTDAYYNSQIAYYNAQVASIQSQKSIAEIETPQGVIKINSQNIITINQPSNPIVDVTKTVFNSLPAKIFTQGWALSEVFKYSHNTNTNIDNSNNSNNSIDTTHEPIVVNSPDPLIVQPTVVTTPDPIIVRPEIINTPSN